MPQQAGLVMVARGSGSTGYQGVVLMLTELGRKEIELARCGHAHKSTRTARSCARRLGREWQRQRDAWHHLKYDD